MQGRPALEVADIFRAHGPAWREAQRGHLSLAQLKVMSAITQCRTAALGGHVLRCDGLRRWTQVSYNSCRNRHCPKCQSSAAKRWLDARQADLLPVEYYHVVFTLPAPIADIAYQNKAALYGLLFDIAAETLLRIAADPKHLGAHIGATLVLHTWGSALTHHPHVHGIVPGGGLASDGARWVACRPGFFLPVRVLSRLFRRRFLEELQRLHDGGQLRFFGEHAALADAVAFKAWLAPLRKCEWVVYAKRPFAGPQAVLAYLSRYTHRVAISNSRLLAMDERGVTFRWKDYRAKGQDTAQGDDAEPAGVHAPVPAACPARRLPPDPALRPAGQQQPAGRPGTGAGAVAGDAACVHRVGRRCVDYTGADLRMCALRPRDGGAAGLLARLLDSGAASIMTTCDHHRPTRRRPWRAVDRCAHSVMTAPARCVAAALPRRSGASQAIRVRRCGLEEAPRAAGPQHPRHSIAIAAALNDHRGVRRGFLPRGLCNTCPDALG